MGVSKDAVHEFAEIIKAERFFKKVELSKPLPVDQESQYPAAYITAHTTNYNYKGEATTSLSAYHQELLVTLFINLKVEHELEHLDVQDMVAKAITRDNRLWNFVQDRDIEMAVWDFNERFPLKEGQITFKLTYRMCEN